MPLIAAAAALIRADESDAAINDHIAEENIRQESVHVDELAETNNRLLQFGNPYG